MKKILILILVLSINLCFTGCFGSGNGGNSQAPIKEAAGVSGFIANETPEATATQVANTTNVVGTISPTQDSTQVTANKSSLVTKEAENSAKKTTQSQNSQNPNSQSQSSNKTVKVQGIKEVQTKGEGVNIKVSDVTMKIGKGKVYVYLKNVIQPIGNMDFIINLPSGFKVSAIKAGGIIKDAGKNFSYSSNGNWVKFLYMDESVGSNLISSDGVFAELDVEATKEGSYALSIGEVTAGNKDAAGIRFYSEGGNMTVIK